MKIKKLNKTHNVYNAGHAYWSAMFKTGEAYTEAIVRMYEAFGPGTPYLNLPYGDRGRPWMFRNRDCSRLNNSNKLHLLYLTTEEQVMFLTILYNADD